MHDVLVMFAQKCLSVSQSIIPFRQVYQVFFLLESVLSLDFKTTGILTPCYGYSTSFLLCLYQILYLFFLLA